jgi:hypothetical protein
MQETVFSSFLQKGKIIFINHCDEENATYHVFSILDSAKNFIYPFEVIEKICDLLAEN